MCARELSPKKPRSILIKFSRQCVRQMLQKLITSIIAILLPFSAAWAESYKVMPSISWGMDRVLNTTDLDYITGITVAITGTICTGTDKLTTDSSGNLICATDA